MKQLDLLKIRDTFGTIEMLDFAFKNIKLHYDFSDYVDDVLHPEERFIRIGWAAIYQYMNHDEEYFVWKRQWSPLENVVDDTASGIEVFMKFWNNIPESARTIMTITELL